MKPRFRPLALAFLLLPTGLLLLSPAAEADAGQTHPDPARDSRQLLTHAAVQPYLAQASTRLDRWVETGLPQVVQAQATAPRTRYKKWNFVVAPYGWLAGTGGTITVDGEENDFDLSFEDLFDLTTGGFQFFAEACYKRFFLSFDGTWATLGHGEDLLGGRADFTVEQTILELHAGYRLIGREFGPLVPARAPSGRAPSPWTPTWAPATGAPTFPWTSTCPADRPSSRPSRSPAQTPTSGSNR